MLNNSNQTAEPILCWRAKEIDVPVEKPESIGDRLQQIRLAKGISRVRVSTDLEFAEDTIAKLEQGGRLPSLNMLKILAVYYGVSTDYIIFGSDKSEDADKTIDRVIEELLRLKKQIQ